MHRSTEPFYPEQPEDLGPWYDAEDIGCSCNDSGFDSEWNWDVDAQCYICSVCGEVQ